MVYIEVVIVVVVAGEGCRSDMSCFVLCFLGAVVLVVALAADAPGDLG